MTLIRLQCCLSVRLYPLPVSLKVAYTLYFLIPSFHTSEMDAKRTPFNMGPWYFVYWQNFNDFHEDNLVKKQIHGRWLKLKLINCFMAITQEPLSSHKRSLLPLKSMGIITRLILYFCFVSRSFQIWRWFEILRLFGINTEQL